MRSHSSVCKLPVANSDATFPRFEVIGQAIRYIDRPMLTARAANGDGEVATIFALEVRDPLIEKFLYLHVIALNALLSGEIVAHGGVQAGERT